MVSRADIEAALWKWTGWQADQRAVDDVLTLVDQYTDALPCHDSDRQVETVRVVQPWSFDDLPEAARSSFRNLVKAKEATAYKRGWEDARKEAAVRPEEGPMGGHTTDVLVEGYRGADGGLWVRLGTLHQTLAEASSEWKTCTKCGDRKPEHRFRKATGSRHTGRRAECRDCENEQRRTNRANKKQVA